MLKNTFNDLVRKDMCWILVDNKTRLPLVVNGSVSRFLCKSQVPQVKDYHAERVYDVYELSAGTWVTVQ